MNSKIVNNMVGGGVGKNGRQGDHNNYKTLSYHKINYDDNYGDITKSIYSLTILNRIN